jgi:nicotinamide-nucleotide amidase
VQDFLATLSKLAGDTQNLFVHRGLTLSLAESCTGGLIAAAVAEQPGASKYFLGGVVSYSSQAKQTFLDVKASTVACLGEVSRPVAQQMARGAKARFQSDWSLSVTGIAGPSGGSPEKPVGTVCFAVAGPGFEVSVEQRFRSATRREIQLESACFALSFLMDTVKA